MPRARRCKQREPLQSLLLCAHEQYASEQSNSYTRDVRRRRRRVEDQNANHGHRNLVQAAHEAVRGRCRGGQEPESSVGDGEANATGQRCHGEERVGLERFVVLQHTHVEVRFTCRWQITCTFPAHSKTSNS
jgi:hypothetical protein